MPHACRRSRGRSRLSPAAPIATSSCRRRERRSHPSPPPDWHAPHRRSVPRRPAAAPRRGLRILAIAPSLMVRPNTSANSADETLEADRLGDMKMDDQRAQSRPERRARFEPFRRRRCDLPAAAGTDAAMAVDAGDGRADGGQLDVIVGMVSGWSAEPSTQAQCGQALSVASMMRSGCSLSARLTPGRPPRRDFTRSGRFAFWPFEGGVLELSGVLGGALSLRLQLRNPRHQRSDLRSLRLDLSRLRHDQADQILLRQSVQRVTIHGYGESSRPLPCQARF